MRRIIYFLNGLAFVGTAFIMLALVETHSIKEWVFNFVMINLIIYMFEVRGLRHRLAEYEKASKQVDSNGK